MKRLTGLALAAGLWSGAHGAAAEPAPQAAPSPPGVTAAPTPHPGYHVPGGAAWSTPTDAAGSRGPRLFHVPRWGLSGRTSQVSAEQYEVTPPAPQSGTPYLPPRGVSGAPVAVGHPLPAPPATAGACATGDYAPCRGSCWERVKAWLCFGPTPNRFPLTPTPFYPPHYTGFPCKEQGLCGPAGCGPNGCAPAGGGPAGAAPMHGHESGGCATTGGGRIGSFLAGLRPFRDRSAKSGPPAGWATAGATIPGYRYAAPVSPAVLGKPVAVPPPVVHTAHGEPIK
jgi:hypothetical protein